MIRYAFLWRSEAARGREEGLKDRPCAVLLAVEDVPGEPVVTVLPITHRPPSDPGLAVELPLATKRRLGLDDARSWVVVTDANRFVWPGPDLRPAHPGAGGDPTFGMLPAKLFNEVRRKFIAAVRKRHSGQVRRTE